MELCKHRGFPIVDGKCGYHGLCHPAPDSCFEKEPKQVPDNPWPDIKALLKGCEKGNKFGSFSQYVGCPWWIWMQNTADFRHLKQVHKSGFDSLFAGEPYDVQIADGGFYSSHKLKVRPHLVKWYSQRLGIQVQDYFLHALTYPAISMTSFLGVFFSEEKAVKGLGNTCAVTTKFFTAPDMEVPPAITVAALNANLRILAEDKAICESWAPTATVTGNWLPGEERVRAYCEVLRRNGIG